VLRGVGLGVIEKEMLFIRRKCAHALADPARAAVRNGDDRRPMLALETTLSDIVEAIGLPVGKVDHVGVIRNRGCDKLGDLLVPGIAGRHNE